MGLVSASPGAPPIGTYTTLFKLIGADMNSTADQPFIPAMGFSRYIIDGIIVTDASGAISLAAGGIYTGAGKTGTIIVLAAQSYTGLTGVTKVVRPALTTAGSDLLTATPILSLSVAMGTPATASFYIMGLAG